MTTEDLQEKYRDKHKELKPSVPLAADSAHLLTEYLDSVSVEFVKKGVMEPYRITRELEEILVGELQQQGSKNKLTYEVTSKVLEKYGSPIQVVDKYIKENKPKLHPILVPADSDISSSKSNSTAQKKKLPLFARLAQILAWPIPLFKKNKSSILATLAQILTWSILLVTVVMEGIMLLSLSSYEFLFDANYYDYAFIVPLLFPFLALEIITGWRGHVIEVKYYHSLRETIRFLTSSVALVMVMWAVNIHQLNWIPFALLPFILVFGIGLLKDRTDLLQSSSLRQKPVARFVLPSYIISGVAYIAALFTLYNMNNNINFTRFESPRWMAYQTDQSLIALVLILSVFGIVLDLRRKYPFSLKKLGYNIIFYFFIYFIYTFRIIYFTGYPDYYWKDEIVSNFPVILNTTMLYTAALAVLIPLLFRREIKTQLTEYRESFQRSLDDYRL